MDEQKKHQLLRRLALRTLTRKLQGVDLKILFYFQAFGNPNGQYFIEDTHQQIADVLGINRVQVTTSLRKLENLNILEKHGVMNHYRLHNSLWQYEGIETILEDKHRKITVIT